MSRQAATPPTPLPVKSVADMVREGAAEHERLLRNPRWGRWRFKRRAFVLEHEAHGYQISLEKCASAAAVLDWLAHLADKTWCTSEDLGELVRAFDALLGFYTPEYGNGAIRETGPLDVHEHLKARGWIGRKQPPANANPRG